MDTTTPLDALYFHAGSRPENIALISGRTSWSYRDLALAVERVARALHARGVRKGDRVALHMLNLPELAISYYACFRIGAIAAPLNTRFKTAELRAVLRRLQPSLYIGQAQLFSLVAPIETDVLPDAARYVVGATDWSCQASSWDSLLEVRAGTVVMPERPHAHDPALLLGTSGTTGTPKFVTHTAATLSATLAGCGPMGFDRPQITINSVPMVHASGLFTLLATLHSGSIHVLVERFDADAVLDAIERYHGTLLLGLPFMYAELLRRQRAQPRRVDSLELCLTGGDVCPVRLQQEFPDVFGTQLYSLWGASEVMGSLVHGLRPGPVTRIAPGAQVLLVDDDGKPVPRGQVGEMLIRGPNVTVGYWTGSGRIEPATRDGWYHSGDLLRQGEQDELWFVARKKDLIIRGGSNIAPLEVERVLLEHPAVLEAAVVGVPDTELGQRVAAFVRLSGAAGNYAMGDILACARGQLADYKVPEWLYVVNEIPRNMLGKIDRRALLLTRVPGGAPELLHAAG